MTMTVLPTHYRATIREAVALIENTDLDAARVVEERLNNLLERAEQAEARVRELEAKANDQREQLQLHSKNVKDCVALADRNTESAAKQLDDTEWSDRAWTIVGDVRAGLFHHARAGAADLVADLSTADVTDEGERVVLVRRLATAVGALRIVCPTA